ncbi:MAG: peptide chain release factor 1 [Rickettsiales bacterium]
MSFTENLQKIIDKHAKLEEELKLGISHENFINISKEYSHLNNIVGIINNYNNKISELDNLKEILENKNEDKEILQIANDEYFKIKAILPDLEKKIKIALLPKDINDDKNAIIEIRAGTGGEEAALFAYTLFNIYQKYAENQKWKFEILNFVETEIGGLKEAVGLISGNGVFAKLKFESGVHRVQRVPKTEVNGRIHTSAATVAVLPEMEEVDVAIDEKDLQIDTYRASGAGGQHINTTDSAIRITHIPTGIVVTQQDQRSQHKNKAKAMKILAARIYDLEYSKKQNDISAQRKEQIGSGDRSERIRTYNFPQSRVTDHRINMTSYKINEIVEFGKLDEIIDAIVAYYEAEKLANYGIE